LVQYRPEVVTLICFKPGSHTQQLVGLIQNMHQSAGTKFILADWNFQAKNAFYCEKTTCGRKPGPGEA